MITSLSIENFKSWKSTGEMRLASITGLFGTNSSGKTSILQLLLLLKQTVDAADRNIALNLGDNRALVSLGTLRDVLHNHDTSQALSWSLTWGSPSIRFECEVTLNEAKEPVVRRFYYQQGDNWAGMTRTGDDAYRIGLGPQPVSRWQQFIAVAVPRPIKSYGFPNEALSQFLGVHRPAEYVVQYERLFEHLHYLGPLREPPLRQYVWAGGHPDDVGTRGELAVGALISARFRTEGERMLESRVSSVLRDLGMNHELSVHEMAPGASVYEVRMKRSAESAEVLLTDVGFGVSQVLPVLVLCNYVPEGSIILLEQPEMHLHPKAQMALADVLIDAALHRHVQIIVESHSEHLLTRLQRRIAEQVLSPDDVALYFCDQADGVSRLKPLEVNKAGGITNWPDEFFGDPLGEAVKMTEAAQALRL